MPPLSLTHLKYASAVLAISVKSVPGCLVLIAPSLIGVPLAFLPLPRPHLEAACLPVSPANPPPSSPPPPPLSLSSSPQAATNSAKPIASAASMTILRERPNTSLILTGVSPPRDWPGAPADPSPAELNRPFRTGQIV